MPKLEFPNETHKNAYEKLIKEWREAEKIPTSPSRLFDGKNFEEFLNTIKKDIFNNERGVNSSLYFLVDKKGEILGAIQIRHHINHINLKEKGGHIGYGISPKYRKKGYATLILQLGLEEAKKLGIQKVLITCDKNNIGSNKVILKNGGIFERFTKDGESNRYWIDINLYKNFQNFWENKWIDVENIYETDFAKKVINYFPDGEKLRLIDIGAGSGRDSLFFAKNRFEVEAFDFSKNALENINNFSEKEKLFIKTTLGNLQSYDFCENLYDIVYSCNSLHYFSFKETKNIIKNIKKSIKNGGYVFLRVKSINDIDFGKGEKLEENFYKNGADLKYYFSKEIISDLFSDFEIIELIEINEKHNKISGEVTKNGFIDLVGRKIKKI